MSINKAGYYAVNVVGCTDPELIGPYKTSKGRDKAARRARNASEDNVVFWLDCLDNHISVGAYSNAFMEGLIN
jgi:hypothetical protein